jgi:hypothetical protein
MSLRAPPRPNGPIEVQFTEKRPSRGRRLSTRYPLKFPAVLYFREEPIRGKTKNISSGGLLMVCSESELEQAGVRVGVRVKVQITGLPIRPDNTNVGLMVEGVVVRKLDRYVAVRRTRHDFVEIK